MDIKTILNLFGKIELSYKEEMKDWFGKVELYCVTDTYGKRIYIISGGRNGMLYKKFTDVDKAIKKFEEVALSDKNIAIKQSIWNSLNPDKDPEAEMHDNPEKMEKEIRNINIKDYYEGNI